MINDLSISYDQLEGDMFKYADDTNVSENITNHASVSHSQGVTDSIVDWSRRNKFELNPSKCKEMMITFQRNQPDFTPITINGTTINLVRKATILGLSMTDDLKWNEHVEK